MKRIARKPTILDVAKKAGVGLMTVSRVINNNASVRPTTRKKVLAAIAELGYRQNEAARLLKGQRAMTIGLIVPDLSDVFFSSCAHTIQQIARTHGYMTLVFASERDPELEIHEAELMADRKVAGMLIVTSAEGDQRLKALQQQGLAIVAFDRPLSGIDTDAVVVENRQGAEQAVRHLIEHGHHNIACVGYDHSVYTVRERIEGYANCMRASGLRPQIFPEVSTLEETHAWIQKTMKGKERPTAIFSLNHRSSVHLLQALSQKKIAIPKEVALIGFDDFDLSSVVVPSLTTVTQSPIELSRRSMALLMERIQHNKEETEFTPAKIVLPVKLVIRSSCGCTPKSELKI